MAIGMGVSVRGSAGTNRIEPKRAFRWMLEVAPPVDTGIQEVIKTTCFSFSRPQITFEKITMHRLNTSYHIRGKGEWQDMTLVMYDGVGGNNSAKAMNTWQRAIFDPNTNEMLDEAAVKADATLKLLNGQGEVLESWVLSGFAPTDINHNSEGLDFSSSESLKVEVTFSVDQCFLVEAA